MDVDIRRVPPPVDWGVTVTSSAVEELAERWRDREFALPAWDYDGLPHGLDDTDWYNFCVVACSILACLWPPDGEEMWTTDFRGMDLVDAPALFSCFTRRLEGGQLDLSVFSRLTAAEFFAGRGRLQLVTDRWERVKACAAAINNQWDGIANLVAVAGRDAEGVVELLATSVPGFDDAPESPLGRLPFLKLARLATAMMAAGGSAPFLGLGRLPVYPDYMLPMVLRHYGILVYEPALAAAVDSRTIIAKESHWELAIRWATVYCGDRLADALRARGVAVTTPALDYALWESAVLGPDAGHMGEHHRTLTLAY